MTDLKLTLASELEDIIKRNFPTDETALKYLERIKDGNLCKKRK